MVRGWVNVSNLSAIIIRNIDENIKPVKTDPLIKKMYDKIISLDTKKGFVRDLKFDSKFNTLTAYFDRQNEGVFEIKFPNLSEIDSSGVN